jgi:hypothetical protein
MTEQELVEFMKIVRDTLGEIANKLVDVWTSIQQLAYVQKKLLEDITSLEARIEKLESIDRDSAG